MAKAVVLPKKPSKLLKLAMADLEACEVDPHYTIDMGVWLKPNGTCAVCMAGAVMAQRLDGERLYDVTNEPDRFGMGIEPQAFGSNEHQLRALDDFRQGYIEDGLNMLDVDYGRACEIDEAFAFDWRDGPRPGYAENPTEWKHTMATLIGVLEAEGL